MKKGYIIYTKYESERNDFFIKKAIDSSKKYDVSLSLLLFEDIRIEINNNEYTILYRDKEIEKIDFVILRMMNYHLAHAFESKNVKVYNTSYVSKICDNKYITYLNYKNTRIPLMDTYLGNEITNDELFFPNVTKPIDSKGGDRVFLNNTIEEYNENIKKYNGTQFIIQKVASDKGKDLRVYVIGNKIIASILRTSNDGFLSNYCRGGSASIYNLNEDEKKLVETIARDLSSDYVGIDFIFDGGKLVLNEIENVVGARMVYEKTDIDIIDLFIQYISKGRIVLASASPRRKDILEKEGYDVDVFLPNTNEMDITGQVYSDELVAECSSRKLISAVEELECLKGIKKEEIVDNQDNYVDLEELNEKSFNFVIVACDTVVVCDDIIIGKPKDFDDAVSILKRLSGKIHKVVSSVSIYKNEKVATNNEVTYVTFRKLTDEEIINYIRDKKPYDKAGSYGIQDDGFDFVSKIEGNMDNVIGFPMKTFTKML